MRLSDAPGLLARRFRVNRGRTAAIANRLQHHGLIAFAEAKKNPPDLTADEFAWLLLAVLSEDGVETAATRAMAYAEMAAPSGHHLFQIFRALLAGEQVGDLIMREGGATATLNGQYLTFGKPAEGGTARFAARPTLAAIAAEFSGLSASQADVAAALNRIVL